MKIFEFSDHREVIRALLQERKQDGTDLTYGKLAKICGVTASYFSQAMAGDQEFNNDQIFALGQFFQLDMEALDFLVLLNECHRCSLAERKRELQQQIEQAQAQHLRVVEYLSFDRVDRWSSPMDDFLCDPLAPILDAQLTVEENLNNPKLLQQKLGLDDQRFARVMELLQNARIIEPASQGYRRVVGETMVYKINTAAKFNAVYSRLKAVEKIFADDPTDLMSTIIFCANEDFVQNAKARILDFQNKALEQYQEKKPTDVYFMNVDLFAVEGGL